MYTDVGRISRSYAYMIKLYSLAARSSFSFHPSVVEHKCRYIYAHVDVCQLVKILPC